MGITVNCSMMDGMSVESFLSRCGLIKQLELIRCASVEANLSLDNCSELTYLKFVSSEEEDYLSSFHIQSQSLRVLWLEGGNNVNWEYGQHTEIVCPALTKFKARNCLFETPLVVNHLHNLLELELENWGGRKHFTDICNNSLESLVFKTCPHQPDMILTQNLRRWEISGHSNALPEAPIVELRHPPEIEVRVRGRLGARDQDQEQHWIHKMKEFLEGLANYRNIKLAICFLSSTRCVILERFSDVGDLLEEFADADGVIVHISSQDIMDDVLNEVYWEGHPTILLCVLYSDYAFVKGLIEETKRNVNVKVTEFEEAIEEELVINFVEKVKSQAESHANPKTLKSVGIRVKNYRPPQQLIESQYPLSLEYSRRTALIP